MTTLVARIPILYLTLLPWIAFSSSVAFAQAADGDPVRGHKLFRQLGCQECHTVRGEGGGGETKAPELAMIFGKTIETADGKTVEVSENYLLESITNPDALVVKDYPKGKMPSRFAQLPEKDLAALVNYVKVLSDKELADKLLSGSGASETKAIPPRKTPAWIWVLMSVCVAIVGSVSIVSMSRHVSWGWIGAIALIPVTGVAAGIGWTNYAPRAGNSSRQFEVVARQFAYSPPVIRVNKGDRVTVALKSEDVLHGFYLDGYGVDEEVRPGETVRFSFVANKEGKFGFRCSHTCGVFHPFMIGNLIVEPNNLFSASVGLCFGLGLAAFLYVAKRQE